MKNKNILELCLAHGLGGLELFVASCYKDFSSKTTCRVVVAPGTKLDNYLENTDKFYIKRNKFFPFIPALRLAKYIDEYDIDIIHFHWTKDSITAVLAKLISKKKPKLVQSRHMRMTRFKDDFYHRWLYENIDMIHAVTLQVKEQLEKFIPLDIQPKIEMVYLGVEASSIDEEKVLQLKREYKTEDKFVVGIVGRIEKGKGQYKVIEAISNLQDLDLKVLIVGSAMNEDYLEELQQKVFHLGLEDKVIFTGFTKYVNEHMKLFDVNVLATENETFGLVIIEAMANNSAVIATNKGGPLEIIKDEVNGLLFDGSSKDLSKKIQRVYENKNLLENIARNGYNSVKEKFDFEVQMKSLYYKINEEEK